ncbi:helix-turn-helix domain-containing protein [Mucilaginibacter corticis]|uniref:Helix-turn-helix domain-containing protein n=1 Tax=Mucilaginibacter corticis TaxID=2597670 RepID=A0A556MU67_9SPHI|nr:helix-turn-helix domain-containing protein [Mucilaginibacter corticis]TSJ43338.1 helix-turn-helix domain-containing protein [Mucilaginibacter corticis]
MKTAIPIYDICSLTQRQDDLLISRFAPYLKSHRNLHLAHKHSFYHLVFFTKGDGSQTIDFQQVPVKPFQIYFMIPGQVHNWAFKGEVDGYIINFSVPFFQSFLLKANYLEEFPFFTGIVDDAVIDIPAASQQKIISLFEDLIRESEEPNVLADDMVRAMMLQLFISVARLSMTTVNKTIPPYNYTLLRSFQKLIEKNYTLIKLPKQYAELLYITPNHLNALCNDVLGIPAGEVIRNRVALEAKRLLINNDLTVLEIANQLNFADNSYFTRFFKKQVGLTPEEFRKTTNNHEHSTHK